MEVCLVMRVSGFKSLIPWVGTQKESRILFRQSHLIGLLFFICFISSENNPSNYNLKQPSQAQNKLLLIFLPVLTNLMFFHQFLQDARILFFLSFPDKIFSTLS